MRSTNVAENGRKCDIKINVHVALQLTKLWLKKVTTIMLKFDVQYG